MGFFGLTGKSPKRSKKAGNDAMLTNTTYNPMVNMTLSSIIQGETAGLTENEVLSIPAVEAAMELITSSIGQLNIKLYSRRENGDLNEIIEDPRLTLLNREANENLAGYDFKRKIARDVLLYGASKSYIKRKGNKIDGIYPLDTKDLTIQTYSHDGYSKYGIVTLNNQSGSFDFYDDLLFSVLRDSDDGITGRGIIKNNEKTLRLALNQQNYETSLMDNGVMPTSVLETDNKVNDDTISRLRQDWHSLYSGAKSVGKTLILEQGLKFKSITMDPNSLDLTNGKKSVLADIARMFNIPESMINSAANKYDSNEANNLYFMQYCLSPILVSIESAANNTLLLENEKDKGFEFKFDTSSLIKSTSKERVETAINEFNAGIITNVEARRLTGNSVRDDIPEHLSLTTGSVLLDINSKELINPNTGETMTTGEAGIKEEPKESVDTNTDEKEVANNDTAQENGDSNVTHSATPE